MAKTKTTLEVSLDGRPMSRMTLRRSTRYLIGRDYGSDLVCHDPFCDLAQIEIVFNGVNWLIRDRGSFNGTLVNDQPIYGEQILRPHDTVRLGALGQFTLLDYSDEPSADRTSQKPLRSKPRDESERGRWLTWVPERRVEELEPQQTLSLQVLENANLRTARVDGLPLENLFFFATDLNSRAVSGELRTASLVDLAERTVREFSEAVPGYKMAGVYLDPKHQPQRRPVDISNKKRKWIIFDSAIVAQLESLLPNLELMATTQMTVF